MPIEIVCPSGLAGKVRGFKAKEAAMLADTKALREGATYESILSACWLETTDPGPYAWLKAEEGAPKPAVDWMKALACDRFWSLLKIRAATYGDEYVFTLSCQNVDCKAKIDWELNLSDLPVKQLPQTSRVVLAAGDNEFSTTLGDGKACKFRLQTGAGEVGAARLLRQASGRLGTGRGAALIQVLASRIVEVEGIGKKKNVRDANEPDPLIEYLGDLEMVDLIDLTETLDEADGGVETTINVECQECLLEQRVELPLGVEFFLPKKRKNQPASSQSGTASSTP